MVGFEGGVTVAVGHTVHVNSPTIMIVSKPSGSHAHNGRLIRKSAIFHQEIALLTQLRTESMILCHRRLNISMEKEQRDYSRHCKQKEPLPCSVLGYTFFAVLTRAPIRFLLPTLFSQCSLSLSHARVCVHGPLTISTERLFSLPRKTNKTILEHDFKPRGFAKSTSRLFLFGQRTLWHHDDERPNKRGNPRNNNRSTSNLHSEVLKKLCFTTPILYVFWAALPVMMSKHQ